MVIFLGILAFLALLAVGDHLDTREPHKLIVPTVLFLLLVTATIVIWALENGYSLK